MNIGRGIRRSYSRDFSIIGGYRGIRRYSRDFSIRGMTYRDFSIRGMKKAIPAERPLFMKKKETARPPRETPAFRSGFEPLDSLF